MIQGSSDRDTERLFYGQRVPAFQHFARQAMRRLNDLDGAVSLQSLSEIRGYRLEPLLGDRAGQYSIRINRQWRLCFGWSGNGPYDVEIVDYHR